MNKCIKGKLYLIVECQLIKVEEMMELENTTVIIIWARIISSCKNLQVKV